MFLNSLWATLIITVGENCLNFSHIERKKAVYVVINGCIGHSEINDVNNTLLQCLLYYIMEYSSDLLISTF